MKNHTENVRLIKAARGGNKKAESEFFSKLAVRFSPFVARELMGYPVLKKRINPAEETDTICQSAIEEIKKLYPLNSPEWSLMRAFSVLQNVLDDFISGILTVLAQEDDSEAENYLFSLLRKKLAERIEKKEWRISREEAQDIVHESLLIIFRKYKDSTFTQGILAWAYGVLDKVRKGDYNRKTRREKLRSENIDTLREMHGSKQTAENEVDYHLFLDEIEKAMSQLSNEDKEIFSLKLKGFSGKEIMRQLGLNRNTLDGRIHRIGKRLRRILEKRGVL
ncbi:RNA polymerase sigma factor [candidate division KSB1 bacterium]|nr:RNA polymerase sigma factor [candidate division KSB1 bacterium]